MNKNVTRRTPIQSLLQIVRIESFQFAHNLYVIFISNMQLLHFLKVINIIILTKIIKIGQADNNLIFKYRFLLEMQHKHFTSVYCLTF